MRLNHITSRYFVESYAVKPTLSERFIQATVKGTLMKMDREYYLKSTGREIRLYVDATTKLDRVTVGDEAKAYVDDDGYITTLQRDE